MSTPPEEETVTHWFDADDREAVTIWALRAVLVLTGAAVLGGAVRIFLVTAGFGG